MLALEPMTLGESRSMQSLFGPAEFTVVNEAILRLMWQPVSPTQVLTNMLSREHSNDSFRRSTQFSGALANLRAAVPNRSQRATSIFAGSHSHFSHLDVLLL